MRHGMGTSLGKAFEAVTENDGFTWAPYIRERDIGPSRLIQTFPSLKALVALSQFTPYEDCIHLVYPTRIDVH